MREPVTDHFLWYGARHSELYIGIWRLQVVISRTRIVGWWIVGRNRWTQFSPIRVRRLFGWWA